MSFDVSLLAVASIKSESVRAERLAAELSVSYLGTNGPDTISDYPFVLWIDSDGLALHSTGRRAPGPIRCDFVGGAAGHRRHYGGGKSQAVARAIGFRSKSDPRVTDLTAGLGQDAFVLAGLGAQVTLVERNPIVYQLLRDGLNRAALAAGDDPELATVLARMRLEDCQDGRQWLQRQGGQRHIAATGAPITATPDVIYLDPMFPQRNKSAGVKKAMAAFHRLVGTDEDAGELLPAALAEARHRVVVKRPAKAPYLFDQAPSFSLTGKSVRFDIYTLRAMAAR